MMVVVELYRARDRLDIRYQDDVSERVPDELLRLERGIVRLRRRKKVMRTEGDVKVDHMGSGLFQAPPSYTQASL